MYKFSKILKFRIYHWQPVLPVVLFEVTDLLRSFLRNEKMPVKSPSVNEYSLSARHFKMKWFSITQAGNSACRSVQKCCLLEIFVPRRNAFWLLSIQVVKKDNLLKNQGSGPREMAQCLNVAVLSVNPSLVPSTDVREVKTTCNQSGFIQDPASGVNRPPFHVHVSIGT